MFMSSVEGYMPNHRSYSSFLAAPAETGLGAFRLRKKFRIRFTKRIMGIIVSITIVKVILLINKITFK